MGFLWKLWTRFVLYTYYHYLQHTQLKNRSVEKFAQEKGRIWNDPKEEDEIRIVAPKLYWNRQMYPKLLGSFASPRKLDRIYLQGV